MPLYAELQRGEAAHKHDHLAHGVLDLRVATLPARYEDLLQHELPLEYDEIRRLPEFAPRFAELCDELAAHDLPATVQHDDLHMANLYIQGERMRLLDWGDASISHPFASLVVTFRFLEEVTQLPPGDPWFARLRDAYLEPWGRGLAAGFALAIRVGPFAHSIAWARQRDHLPEESRAEFDRGFSIVLRRRSPRRSSRRDAVLGTRHGPLRQSRGRKKRVRTMHGKLSSHESPAQTTIRKWVEPSITRTATCLCRRQPWTSDEALPATHVSDRRAFAAELWDPERRTRVGANGNGPCALRRDG